MAQDRIIDNETEYYENIRSEKHEKKQYLKILRSQRQLNTKQKT